MSRLRHGFHAEGPEAILFATQGCTDWFDDGGFRFCNTHMWTFFSDTPVTRESTSTLPP